MGVIPKAGFLFYEDGKLLGWCAVDKIEDFSLTKEFESLLKRIIVKDCECASV